MKQYTIYSEQPFTDFSVEEGQITGTLYKVLLENDGVSEEQQYFVRDSETKHDVLSNAVKVLETKTESKESAADDLVAVEVS